MADRKAHFEVDTRVVRGTATNRTQLDGSLTESLRERKKRLTRQMISDTATGMFLEHGFEAVRISDVAGACGVSEKTVYNYFSTKESLVLDREELMIEVVRRALGPDAPDGSPIDAFVDEISVDVVAMIRWWSDLPPSVSPAAVLQRFRDLIESTPSLRAAERDMNARVTEVAAEALAARVGVDPMEPEPQIAATALCGLWGVMHRALVRHAPEAGKPTQMSEAVMDEVRRAARLIDTGLWSFGLEVQGTPNARQFKLAAEAAADARKQVVEAVRAAKVAWVNLAEQARSIHDASEADARRGAKARAYGGDPSRRRRDKSSAANQEATSFASLDLAAMRTARDEIMKAKRDLAQAKRQTQQAARQAKAHAKKQTKAALDSRAKYPPGKNC